MSERQRLQIDMTPATAEAIQELKDIFDATSIAEVIKRTIKICQFIAQEIKQGSTLKIHRTDGSIVEVKLFF